MSITKKIRFEVFKRDDFKCAYCGRTPPEVSLEVDHIIPKSKDGKDDINNLITSCFDCNRGKKNILLDNIPNKLKENIEILKEKENQLKEYNKFLLEIERRTYRESYQVERIFRKKFQGIKFTNNFKKTIRTFLKKMSLFEVKDAMDIACERISDPDSAAKYFCGICWNKIKNRDLNK